MSHVDVLPPVLDLVGLPPLDGAAGRSLSPQLLHREPIPERTVFSDTGKFVTGFRGDRFVEMAMVRVKPEPEWRFETFRWESSDRWVPDDAAPELPAFSLDFFDADLGHVLFLAVGV